VQRELRHLRPDTTALVAFRLRLYATYEWSV